jgi:RNA polymerase primary sigma factor
MQIGLTNSNCTEKSIMDRSLEQYLSEIGKYKLIKPEEETRLAVKIREGDIEAQRKMIEANLKFVVSVAKLYQNQGLSLGDLINEGNLGLIKASKLFDETRGFKFISYAVWWIKQSIMSAIADQSRVVRLPLNRVGDLTKLKKAYRKLEGEFERKPTVEELSELLNLSVEDVSFTLQKLSRGLSFDAPVDPNPDSESEATLLETIPDDKVDTPDKKLNIESLMRDIEETLSILDEREKKIVSMSLGLGRARGVTLGEIGEKFNLTRERIRQIKDKALRKLRSSEKKKILQEYLGQPLRFDSDQEISYS